MALKFPSIYVASAARSLLGVTLLRPLSPNDSVVCAIPVNSLAAAFDPSTKKRDHHAWLDGGLEQKKRKLFHVSTILDFWINLFSPSASLLVIS